MTLLRHVDDLQHLAGPLVLAIGVFDGVHAGHQQVIALAQERARQRGATLVLMTFDPHPLRLLRPDLAPKLLCSTEHQLRLLERYGVAHVLLCPFDETIASLSAEDFVRRLVGACRPLDSIFVGENWRFGQGRRGDVALIRSLNVEAFGVPTVMREGMVISSTLVRQAVERGDLALAKVMLNRDYSVLGHVVEGRKLGRTLGFPTANLDVQNEQLPPAGVYAVRVWLDEEWKPAVANLGRRPTVEAEAQSLSLEVHLFDLQRDLYGQVLEVSFIQHLRAEVKFSGLEALKAQIGRDSMAAREVLKVA